MYRLITSQSPQYLFDQLTFSRSLRTRNLIVPQNRLSMTNASFFVQAIVIWNSVPLAVRNAVSVVRFKVLCKQLFSSINDMSL